MMTSDDLALGYAFASAAGIDRERVLSVTRTRFAHGNVPLIVFQLDGALPRDTMVRAAKAMLTTLFPTADSWLQILWDNGQMTTSRADIERLP